MTSGIEECDLVILGAHILTMDPSAPRASALAVRKGKIIAVGNDADIHQFTGDQTTIIQAEGRTVLPGLIDSHVHIFQGAAELDCLPVAGIIDLEDLRPLVQDYVALKPDEALILGVGAFYDLCVPGKKCPRLALDDILKDRPFALLASDLHTMWANSAALDRIGFLHGASTAEGSHVVMGKDGLADGTLLEIGAFGPLLTLSRTGGRHMAGYMTGDDPVPPATDQQRESDKDLLRKGLAHIAAHGITTVHNMDGNTYQLELLTEIEAEGQLTCRVQIPFHFKNFDPIERLQDAAEMHRRFSSDKIWSGRIKMFMDGVMESRTALMTRPYPDSPGVIGEAIFDPKHFNEACIFADAMGLQISVHAVGDLAVKRVLDGYQAAAQANGRRDSRHRIEHIELITQEDIQRMKSLGVIASMQPRHAAFGGFFLPLAPNTVLYPEEYPYAYAWKALRNAGIPLAFSTDWPVVPVDAMATIQSAVAPINLGPDWPDQTQTLMETLDSYTRVNAWIAFREGHHGQIIPTFAADLVMLDQDIESVDVADIGKIRPVMTICDGQIVFDATHS